MNKSKDNPSPVYVSEKLIFCAWLVATGKAKLTGTRPTGNGRQVAFLLSYVPSEEEVAEFFGGTATVPALKYAETIANLKSAAYEGLRRNGRF